MQIKKTVLPNSQYRQNLEDPNYKTALQLMLKSMIEAYEENQSRNHQLVLIPGQTPEILINYGFKPLSISITGKVIDKTFFDHGVTRTQLERIYKILESPKSIYRSNNNDVPNGSVLISYETNKNSLPLIIAIHPNKQIGRQIYNNIASIYFKDGDAETRWKKMNLLQWEAFQK